MCWNIFSSPPCDLSWPWDGRLWITTDNSTASTPQMPLTPLSWPNHIHPLNKLQLPTVFHSQPFRASVFIIYDTASIWYTQTQALYSKHPPLSWTHLLINAVYSLEFVMPLSPGVLIRKMSRPGVDHVHKLSYWMARHPWQTGNRLFSWLSSHRNVLIWFQKRSWFLNGLCDVLAEICLLIG